MHGASSHLTRRMSACGGWVEFADGWSTRNPLRAARRPVADAAAWRMARDSARANRRGRCERRPRLHQRVPHRRPRHRRGHLLALSPHHNRPRTGAAGPTRYAHPAHRHHPRVGRCRPPRGVEPMNSCAALHDDQQQGRDAERLMVGHGAKRLARPAPSRAPKPKQASTGATRSPGIRQEQARRER